MIPLANLRSAARSANRIETDPPGSGESAGTPRQNSAEASGHSVARGANAGALARWMRTGGQGEPATAMMRGLVEDNQPALIERNDTSRPLTPSVVTMVDYADPSRLPPSTGRIREQGRWKRLYGSVRVLEEYAHTYEELRRCMAQSGREIRKYLAHMETRDYPITEICPFSLLDDSVIMPGGAETTPAEAISKERHFPASVNMPAHWRVIVAFPIDEGHVLPNGELASAAARAAHECAHSARYIVNRDGTLTPPREGGMLDEVFQDLDEHAVIDQVENQVSKALRQGQRDCFGDDGCYLTPSLTSIIASDRQAAQIIDEGWQQLSLMTDRMKTFGFPNVSLDTPVRPGKTLRDLYEERASQHANMIRQLGNLLPLRDYESSSSLSD